MQPATGQEDIMRTLLKASLTLVPALFVVVASEARAQEGIEEPGYVQPEVDEEGVEEEVEEGMEESSEAIEESAEDAEEAAEAAYEDVYGDVDDDARMGDRTLLTRYGMSAMIGGGVTGFTGADITDFTDPGGSWTARLILGTRVPLGIELAYVGSAQNIDAVGLDDSAALLSTAVEGALRLNLIPDQMWQPYLFGGVAWKRYSVVNEDFNTSSVAGRDDVAEIPLGIGVAMRYRGFVVDARGSWAPAFDADLLPAAAIDDEDPANLATWGANLRLGWEF
jgi:hypothetical protein